MKKILTIFAGLVVICFAAVLFLPKFIDWNKYKPQIASAVMDSTGRELKINGDINLSIFPDVEFSASDIHLSNAPGMEEPEMLSLGAVSAKLGLFPILLNKLKLDSLVVSEPSIHLGIDKDGQPNWVFDSPTQGGQSKPREKSSEGKSGLPFKEIVLGDVRIVKGLFSCSNALTGQKINAQDINLQVSLPGLTSLFSLNSKLILNGEPVTLDVSVNTLQKMLEGVTSQVKAKLASKHVTVGYDGELQQKPAPRLDGVFDLDIPSGGKLAAWLNKPLDPKQPDPGPVKLKAVFKGEGSKVILTEGTIEGKAMKAKATGSFDSSGDITKVALYVESGVFDLDRYLPPPSDAKPEAAKNQKASPPSGDFIAGLSEKPFDLIALRKTEADIKIAVAGVKAMGYKIGKASFSTTIKDGILNADLAELGLYGGSVKARVKLSDSKGALGVDSEITINKVNVGELAKAVTGDQHITGVASGAIKAKGSGANPKALAENLRGGITFDLGGVKGESASKAAISELQINLDLPGVASSPSLNGSVEYNNKKINLDLTMDPLKKVFSGESFALKAAITSKVVNVAYEGRIQRKPVPGLDGAFSLDIPSVGRLAKWAGQPLDKGRPDPGPLNVKAVFKGDGAKVALKEAVITGKAMKATANGSYDGSGKIAKVVLNVESGILDVDRYLPPPSREKKETALKKMDPAPSDDILAGISQEPFDLSALQNTEVDARIALAGINAMGYKIGNTNFSASLKKGVLTANLAELALYGGSIKGSTKLDGSGGALGLDASLTISGVKMDKLPKAATGGELKVSGVASGAFKANGRGANPRTLAESLRGKANFALEGANIQNAGKGVVSYVKVDLDIPGLDGQPRLKGSVVYNKERVNLDLNLDPIKKVLGGGPFMLKASVTSKLLNLSYDGKIQHQRAPGLDGTIDLDVSSVGKLAKWVGSPLAPSQPDPGPIKVYVSLGSDGVKTTIKEAKVEGKALKMKVGGSFDGGKTPPFLTAKLNVEEADLTAYLPKDEANKEKKKTAPGSGPKKSGGWSAEPLDFSALTTHNGDILVEIGSLKYKDIVIKPGRIKAVLNNGVLKADIEKVNISGGSITGGATINGSKPLAGIDYTLNISGVRARPLLMTFADNERLSGTMDFQAKGKMSGRNQKELIRSLNGDGRFKFLDGAIHGIDIPGTLRKAKTLGFGASGESKKTDFAEISGSFNIKDGVLENDDFKALAPLVRLSGAGKVPMPPQTVDYKVTAKLVASLKGQGGDDALAGLPIPVRVVGPWDNIDYNVDWTAALTAAFKDPDRLKNMPGEWLKKGEVLGLNSLLSKASETSEKVGGALKSVKGALTGGSAKEGGAPALENALKSVTGAITAGGAKEGASPTEKATGPGNLIKGILKPKATPIPSTTGTSEKQPKEEEPAPIKSLNKLKGLLGR